MYNKIPQFPKEKCTNKPSLEAAFQILPTSSFMTSGKALSTYLALLICKLRLEKMDLLKDSLPNTVLC